jgi:hypothetical protein
LDESIGVGCKTRWRGRDTYDETLGIVLRWDYADGGIGTNDRVI